MFARVMSVFTEQYAVVLNLYFLLGFPAAALTAAWCMRVAGLSRVAATPLAVLFAFAPYHFYRSEHHLALAAYWPVPLGMALVLLVMARQPLWRRRTRGPRWSPLAWFTTRSISTLSIVLVLGTASSYYSLFTLFFLAFAGLLTLVRDRRVASFLGSVTAGFLLLTVMFVNLAPDLLYAREHGQNVQSLGRSAAETEVYALEAFRALAAAQQ